MKLSEAIREGAKLRPIGFMSFFTIRDGKLCSCALGAAYEAISKTFVDPHPVSESTCPELDSMRQLFNIKGKIPNPTDNNANQSVLGVVIDMNDCGKYTREEIAAYLEIHGY